MGHIRDIEHLRRLIPEPPPIGGKKATAAKVLDYLDDQSLEFISTSPFMILASNGRDGIELSPKGDHPGFVEVENSRTLLIPERSGNGLAFGLQNMIADNRVGAMFFRPNANELLRITGRVDLVDDADICQRLQARGAPAVLAIRLHAERVFFHCARSLLRARVWEPKSWPDKMRVSFGRIIATALKQKELEAKFDEMAEEYNAKL